MSAKRYKLGDKVFTKVVSDRSKVHVVEQHGFWAGDQGWQHRTICGLSIAGTPISLASVNCKECRKAVEKIYKDLDSEKDRIHA